MPHKQILSVLARGTPLGRGLSLARGLGNLVGLGKELSGGGSRSKKGKWDVVLVYNIIPEVIAAVEANAREAVAQTAREIAEDARFRAPVQTGRLRSSIESRAYRQEGEISVGADYGAFVEYGTYKMAAQPFLSPAVESHKDKFFDRIGKGGFAKWGGA